MHYKRMKHVKYENPYIYIVKLSRIKNNIKWNKIKNVYLQLTIMISRKKIPQL